MRKKNKGRLDWALKVRWNDYLTIFRTQALWIMGSAGSLTDDGLSS